MKTAEQIRQCKKSNLDIIMAAIEQAAENGEERLNLYTWHSFGTGGTGGYYKYPLSYNKSDLETLQTKGFQVVTYKDWNSGVPILCWFMESMKGYYTPRHAITW